MPGVNKSTVYRTLELLVDAGCVYKSELDDRVIYHHAEEGHHHHLVCGECGQTYECGEDIFSGVERLLSDNYGFSASFRHQIIKGLCRNCLGKEIANNHPEEQR